MKKKILITGGSGLLALNWAIIIRKKFDTTLGLHDRKVNLKGTKNIFLNLDSKEALTEELKKLQPHLIIHTAGLTNIETCESNPALAKYINVELTRNLTEACKELNINMIYISTDHLFSGTKSFIDEDYPVSPVNVYSKTKSIAEVFIQDTLSHALIIRTNFYAWGTKYRHSFSDMVINNLREGKKISLFKDIYYTPMLVEPLVNVVHELVDKDAKGIFNVVGDERISKFDFGQKLAKEFNLDKNLINKETIINAPKLTSRPHDMSLSNQKVKNFLGKEIGGIDQHILKLKEQELNGLTKELQLL